MMFRFAITAVLICLLAATPCGQPLDNSMHAGWQAGIEHLSDLSGADPRGGLHNVADAATNTAGAAVSTAAALSDAVMDAVEQVSRLPQDWTVSAVLDALRGEASSLAQGSNPRNFWSVGSAYRRALAGVAGAATVTEIETAPVATDTAATEQATVAGNDRATDAFRRIERLPILAPQMVAYSYQAKGWINQRVGLQAALGMPRDDSELLVGVGVDVRF